MSEGVRFRTLPLPDDVHEQAFRQLLEELAGAIDGFDRDEPDAELLVEARSAARNVVRAWEALPVGSPYRDVVGDAALLLDELAEAAWSFDAVVARDLEELHADVVFLVARREVMTMLAPAVARNGLRRVAQSAGVSVGHLSELSNGRGGLPRPRTARAIDEAAGTRIEELVEAARAEALQLRRVAREREGEATRARGRRAPSVSDALTQINLALVEDPELLVLVERLITTPRAARRGILDLLTALRGGG
jgi:transcriptional regulator with XRE-family HTH domain